MPETTDPQKLTAIENLKINGIQSPSLLPDLGGTIAKVLKDKEHSPQVATILSKKRIFGGMISNLLIHNPDAVVETSLVNYFGQALSTVKPAKTETYKSTPEQNKRIDFALSTGISSFIPGNKTGIGAAARFKVDRLNLGTTRTTKIAIIGYGAAGILVSYALRQIGFDDVKAFEKTDKERGIWNREDVVNGSRNNPFKFDFQGGTVQAAPGEGSEVSSFLSNYQYGALKNTSIESFVPGDNFNHKFKTISSVYGSGEDEYPIVINCTGLGKPKPLSDKIRMETKESATSAGAKRWQKQLNRKDVEGKRFVFIGLGNSTAEMLRQIHRFQDDGIEVDYRILTHYPKEAVLFPDDVVEGKDLSYFGKKYRVFRDISKPNLVDFQGDLPLSRYDYFRALRAGKIVSDVVEWQKEDSNVLSYRKRYEIRTNYQFDHLYVLTGYKQPEEEIKNFGIGWDKVNQCPRYDYDGEFLDEHKKKIRGYFGFGSVLEAPHNPNAIVIPGMLFRLGDLLFGVIMRAAEYQLSKGVNSL